MLLKDVAILDKMYELNLSYFRDLTIYILAGKKKLGEMRDGKLKELIEKAHASGLPEDAQAAKDLEEMCNRFEKKLHDLELTRMISIQMGPQTRLLQNNDTLMIEKIQTSLVNTIPLWKSQMVLALGLERSPTGHGGPERSDQYDQRAAEKELGNAENGHHRHGQGGRAGHRGHRNLRKTKRRSDLYLTR